MAEFSLAAKDRLANRAAHQRRGTPPAGSIPAYDIITRRRHRRVLFPAPAAFSRRSVPACCERTLAKNRSETQKRVSAKSEFCKKRNAKRKLRQRREHPPPCLPERTLSVYGNTRVLFRRRFHQVCGNWIGRRVGCRVEIVQKPTALWGGQHPYHEPCCHSAAKLATQKPLTRKVTGA